MSKKVNFKNINTIRGTEASIDPNIGNAIDQWVNGDVPLKNKNHKPEGASTSQENKKLTIILPAIIHQNLKQKCVAEQITIREKVIALIEQAISD
ncbi:MAG: hypothetical protein KA477_00070 [Candidatus Levybacteria bacterium]|jgi:hypothetical protein|nr:hypothetical protein [Candidatus Levybacteria bacterium]